MAFLEDVFGKKWGQQAMREPPPQPQEASAVPSDIPVDHVISMRSQGLSNNQVIQNLQRAGYSVDLINNAINQADIKEGIVATPFQMNAGASTMPSSRGGNPMYPMSSQQMEMPNQGSQSMGGFSGGSSGDGQTEERIQEIAEAIIEEKWAELITNVNKILDWKDATETRIARIEQAMQDMKDSFDRLHEGVLGKISDYDHGLQDVGTEIKALEKVFQKILPGFMENVNELGRITQQMKKPQNVVKK